MPDSSLPPSARRRLRQGRDRLATALVTAGGIGVIVALLAIGVFLAVIGFTLAVIFTLMEEWKWN